MSDDWARFCEMMEREGWTYLLAADWFVFGNVAYAPDGKYWSDLRLVEKHTNVGDWRKWLAAGSTPVPW